MTPDQVAKLMMIDADCRAEHAETMKALNNPWTQPVDGPV
jgi:hypothetical protein